MVPEYSRDRTDFRLPVVSFVNPLGIRSSSVFDRCLQAAMALLILSATQPGAFGQEDATQSAPETPHDLSERIDQTIAETTPILLAPRVDDELLLRRLYLDLVGVPPRLDEVESYLNDADPKRLENLVDDLLNRAEFVEHWTERFDVMLMERRANPHISQDDWTAWLRAKIAGNSPLHQWWAALLDADGAPGDSRAAARFITARGAAPHLVTRDLGRLFFGQDLQCAQCHDHPSVSSYFQEDYHGLLGFVSSLSLQEVKQGDKKFQVIAEKVSAEAPFESVFDRGKLRRVTPHIPGEHDRLLVWSIPGEEYDAPVQEGFPSRPQSSPRGALADRIRAGECESFNRNLANRIWALVFGQGIVHPVDLQHADNPPRYPELLDVLSDGLVTHHFALKAFLRDIVLTDTYQRGMVGLQYRPYAMVDSEEQRPLTVGQPRPVWFVDLAAASRARIANLEDSIEASLKAADAAEAALNAAAEACDAAEAERVQSLAQVDAARSKLVASLDKQTKAEAEQTNAKATHDAAVDLVEKIKVASQAVSAVSAALADDAEVKSASDLLAARLEAAASKVDPAKAQLEAKQQQLQQIQAECAQLREALVASQSKATEADSLRTPLRSDVLSKRAEWTGARTLVRNQQRELLFLRQIIKADELFAQLESIPNKSQLAEQVTQLASRLGSAAGETASAPEDSPEDAITEKYSAHAEMLAKLASTQAEIQQLVQSMQDSQQHLELLREQQADVLALIEGMLDEQFYASGLKPLSPEQICWSTLHVTGVLDRYIQKHAAAIDKEKPLGEGEVRTEAQERERYADALRRARKELAGYVTQFARLYGAGPGQPPSEFFASADQALYTSNDGSVFSWSAPAAGNAAQAALENEDPAHVAINMYRGILTRSPSPEETQMVAEYLATADVDRNRLIQEMVWGLLTSAEFRFSR